MGGGSAGRRENTNHTGIMIGHLLCFDNFALTSVDSFTSLKYLLEMDLATFIAFSTFYSSFLVVHDFKN